MMLSEELSGAALQLINIMPAVIITADVSLLFRVPPKRGDTRLSAFSLKMVYLVVLCAGYVFAFEKVSNTLLRNGCVLRAMCRSALEIVTTVCGITDGVDAHVLDVAQALLSSLLHLYEFRIALRVLDGLFGNPAKRAHRLSLVFVPTSAMYAYKGSRASPLLTDVFRELLMKMIEHLSTRPETQSVLAYAVEGPSRLAGECAVWICMFVVCMMIMPSSDQEQARTPPPPPKKQRLTQEDMASAFEEALQRSHRASSFPLTEATSSVSSGAPHPQAAKK